MCLNPSIPLTWLNDLELLVVDIENISFLILAELRKKFVVENKVMGMGYSVL